MTVKELMKKLEELDGSLEVWAVDEVEGNDCELTYIKLGQSPYDMYSPESKPYDVVYLGSRLVEC